MQTISKKNEYLAAFRLALQTDHYENVSYEGEYNGRSVYSAFSSEDLGKFIGLPSYILAKGDDVRWANEDERLAMQNRIQVSHI